MSWIRTVPVDDATPPLASMYERIAAARGGVSNLWQVLGLDPAGLGGAFAHHRSLIDDPAPLTPAQAEMVAVVVSATNGCAYGIAEHGPRLAEALGDEGQARAIVRDYREANLAARDRVLLDAAVALTCEPGERTREDVERLREYGFSDEAILKAVEIAAFQNLVDRLATALGVEVEPGREVWEFEILA